MNTRTIAASVLTLGLLTSGALAQGPGNNYACPTDQRDRANYIDCIDTAQAAQTMAFGVAAINPVHSGPVGDFVDETPAESNQRSGK